MWSLVARWFERRHLRRNGPKIFIIGPSKCATTSLHEFFIAQGISSLHCRDGRAYVALEIHRRLKDIAKLRRYLDRSIVYSDMVHMRTRQRYNSAVEHFRLFHELYPDAYFIFNDRDIDSLLGSMKRHKGGSSIRLRTKITGETEEEILAGERAEYESHKEAVFLYFRDNQRFMHFHIERDRIERLIEHLAPDYTLQADFWGRHNVSRSVERTVLQRIRRRYMIAFRWQMRLASLGIVLLGTQLPLQAALITDRLDVIPGF